MRTRRTHRLLLPALRAALPTAGRRSRPGGTGGATARGAGPGNRRRRARTQSPVPNVITASTPVPVTTPAPCTSASLRTRVGRPNAASSAAWASNPRQPSTRTESAGVPGPEQPRVVRGVDDASVPDHPGHADRDAVIAGDVAQLCGERDEGGDELVGPEGYGVGMRTRSPIGSAAASSSSAFRPVPPQSIDSVTRGAVACGSVAIWTACLIGGPWTTAGPGAPPRRPCRSGSGRRACAAARRGVDPRCARTRRDAGRSPPRSCRSRACGAARARGR